MGSFIPQPSKIPIFESLIQKNSQFQASLNTDDIFQLLSVWSDIRDSGVVIL